MVLIARVVNQVQGCLVDILSAVARRVRRDFDLSITSLVAGFLCSTLRLFALGLATLLGSGATLLGWRLRAKRRRRSGVSALAISLTFSMIVILTAAVGSFIHFYLDQRAHEREGMEAALRPNGKNPNPNEASTDDHQRAQEREEMEDALHRDGKSPSPKEASSGDHQRAQEREGMEVALRRDGKSPSPKEASSGDHQLALSKKDFKKLPETKSHEENSNIALLAVRKRDIAELSSSLLGEMSAQVPDLRSFKLERVDKTLFCHNDNRNGTCQTPGAIDLDCRTMVGGLEKRLLKKRLLARLKTPTIINLRRAPPVCTQKGPFFDTPDALHGFLDEAAHRSLPNLPAPMGSQRIERSGAPTCAWVVGTASTYNPSRTRHGSDDMQTASGELYDPTAWTAAIQIDLRELFGGVRYGKNYQPAFALVESGEKRLIIKINDVGPLKPGRAIDLNERSMRYFDPSLQLGLISDVKITPLPGKDWTPGPISDEQLIKLAIAE